MDTRFTRTFQSEKALVDGGSVFTGHICSVVALSSFFCQHVVTLLIVTEAVVLVMRVEM